MRADLLSKPRSDMITFIYNLYKRDKLYLNWVNFLSFMLVYIFFIKYIWVVI